VHSAVAVRWASPEVLSEQTATAASDVYSLGVTMWECFSQAEEPFADLQTHSGITVCVMQGKRPPRPPGMTNEAVWHLIQAAWGGDPDARPSAGNLAERLEEILASPIAPHGKTLYRKTPASVGEAHYSGILPKEAPVPKHYGGIFDETVVPSTGGADVLTDTKQQETTLVTDFSSDSASSSLSSSDRSSSLSSSDDT
jgi:serine/threonine protein kinase